MAIIKIITSIILLYFQLFSINFSFFPLGPRSVFTLLFIIILTNSKQVLGFFKNSGIIKCFFYLLIWAGLSSITVLGYGTRDFYFISFLISQCNTLLSSVFLAYIFYFKFNYDSDKILNLTIFSIFLFGISGIIMYFIPSIKDYILSITVRSSSYELEFIENTPYRLIGFGPAFFGAGVMSGLGLILLSVKLTSKLKHKSLYILMYLTILFSGLLAARTTLIGFFISLFILIFNYKFFRLKYLISIIGLLIIIYWITMYMITNNEKMNITNISRFGLEFYYNFTKTGKLSISSIDNLMEMIKMPKSFFTYILGDGYFKNPTTYGFYQNIDIGYLRLLYYTGLFSLISLIMYYYKLFYSKWFIISNRKFIINSLFFYFLIINFKGLVDFNAFIFLILIINYFQHSKIIVQNDQKFWKKHNSQY